MAFNIFLINIKAMKKIILTSLIVLLCCTANLSAQVAINNNGDASPPDPAAQLDVRSTTAGVLMPRMSSAQIHNIVDPATGLEVFCNDSGDQGIYFFDGNIWLKQTSIAVQLQAQIFKFNDLNIGSGSGTGVVTTDPVSFTGGVNTFTAIGCDFGAITDPNTITINQAGNYYIRMTAYLQRVIGPNNIAPLTGAIQMYVNDVFNCDFYGAVANFGATSGIVNLTSMSYETMITLNIGDRLTFKGYKMGTTGNYMSLKDLDIVFLEK